MSRLRTGAAPGSRDRVVASTVPGGGPQSGGVKRLGIEEPAAHLGGRMTLESTPGNGSTLRVEVAG
jgi:hypothetical protein